MYQPAIAVRWSTRCRLACTRRAGPWTVLPGTSAGWTVTRSSGTPRQTDQHAVVVTLLRKTPQGYYRRDPCHWGIHKKWFIPPALNIALLWGFP